MGTLFRVAAAGEFVFPHLLSVNFTGEVHDNTGSPGLCFLGFLAVLCSLCAHSSLVRLVLLVVERTLGILWMKKHFIMMHF